MAEHSNELRFAVTLQGVEPPDVFQHQVRELEGLGFSQLWVTDSSLHARYVYAYLTLAALNSERLLLGTGVTNPFTRHPGMTINAIATVDEISRGRMILGIGAGDSPTSELGYAPARRRDLAEMVSAARRLFSGEILSHNDSTYRWTNAQLHYRYRDQVPVYMAGSGPRMLELAGEIADGVIAQCGLFPAAVDLACEHIATGAQRAGRSLDDIDLWIMACGTISEDRRQALDGSRAMAAWFARMAPYYCQVAGVDPALVKRIQEVYSGGEFHLAEQAAALVPDEMVELFTLAGTPDEARDRIARLADRGVNGINFMPIGPRRTASFQLFARFVAPLRTGNGTSSQ
ncbi:MAG: LLM class flavin-dependent oxidoreductase [Ardenticatenaceae bacterium]|nr:LLM class flavin-dependent oxidoreductase [Ardenticatenaceae bacterium]